MANTSSGLFSSFMKLIRILVLSYSFRRRQLIGRRPPVLRPPASYTTQSPTSQEFHVRTSKALSSGQMKEDATPELAGNPDLKGPNEKVAGLPYTSSDSTGTLKESSKPPFRVQTRDHHRALKPVSRRDDTSLSDHVRNAMRSIPQSVVVVTSTDPLSPDPDDRYRGMTVSSFNTVSLDPDPIVSFNIKVPSATHDAIVNSSKFLVHTLSTAPIARQIADHFAKGRGKASFRQSQDDHIPFQVRTRPPFIDKASEPPMLTDRPFSKPSSDIVTFPYAFSCEYSGHSLKVADHVIITAKIVQIFRTPWSTSPQFEVPPVGELTIGLAYADGEYRLASPIDLQDQNKRPDPIELVEEARARKKKHKQALLERYRRYAKIKEAKAKLEEIERNPASATEMLLEMLLKMISDAEPVSDPSALIRHVTIESMGEKHSASSGEGSRER